MSEDSKKIRILIVDGPSAPAAGYCQPYRRSVDMTLVAEAANGREAIQQFRTHLPDITLMDLQMAEMNGLDAMIAIHGEFPDARIVVLTTHTGDVQAKRAVQAGVRAYL
jgi:DNA-binding NarL/FixJ family response regulator